MIANLTRERIFLCTRDTDMRKSFDSLCGLVRSSMHLDPRSGCLFVFKNKRGDRIKCIYWDETGFAMWYKVLQRGTFQFPNLEKYASAGLEIDATTMRMILDGIDLSTIRRRPRFRVPPTPLEKSRPPLELSVSLLEQSSDSGSHDHPTP